MIHHSDCPSIQIAKRMLCDHTLTFEERGFLSFLLTKPPQWEIRVDALSKETGASPAKIYRLLKALIKSGYVQRTDIRRNREGRFEQASLYEVSDARIHEGNGQSKNRSLDSVPF